jgi:hypothetical protein
MPITQRPGVANVGSPLGQNLPAHFDALVSVNPKLAAQLKSHAGLRKLFDDNKDAISKTIAPGAGQVRADMTDVTWTHTTSIVPPKVRDEEFIVVVAQGSAYKSAGFDIPLSDGRSSVHMDGQVVFAGRTGDFPWVSEKDMAAKATDPKDKAERLTEESHYPGSGYTTVGYPLFGKPGEDVTISYVRFNPDAQGRVNGREAAWAPTSKGPVFNTGYEERTSVVKLEKAKFVRDDGEVTKAG